tara:strand:- start:870 stop:1151 length:282 start_codon:yes stop_codon:yes gene_type:complete
VNKVPMKKGYVPNKYTGRSMMYNGGMDRKKAAMGYSAMDEEMDRKMKKKMRSGAMGGGRQMYGHGGKAKSDIYAMETACNAMAGYNKSLPKGR